ncbi:MAG: hypothetical protein ACLGIG_06855 [Actinomycetes bacterium]
MDLDAVLVESFPASDATAMWTWDPPSRDGALPAPHPLDDGVWAVPTARHGDRFVLAVAAPGKPDGEVVT